MHASVRPYLTAGVALAGASVIAVAPVVAPPLPDIQVPAITSSATVELSATWEELFENTTGNFEALLEFVTEAPFPILQQVFANQSANFEAIFEALGATAEELVTGLTEGLPAALEAAFGELTDGNIVGFVNGLVSAAFVPLLPLLSGDLPLALQEALVSTLQNAVNVVAALTDPANVLLLAGLAGPFLNVVGASAVAVQNIVDSFDGGSPLEAFINAPATVLDGFLNGGYGPNLIDLISPGAPVTLTAGGVLSLVNTAIPPFSLPGPIAALVELQRIVAEALGWTLPPAALVAETTAVEETPVEQEVAVSADRFAADSTSFTPAATVSFTLDEESGSSSTGGTDSSSGDGGSPALAESDTDEDTGDTLDTSVTLEDDDDDDSAGAGDGSGETVTGSDGSGSGTGGSGSDNPDTGTGGGLDTDGPEASDPDGDSDNGGSDNDD